MPSEHLRDVQPQHRAEHERYLLGRFERDRLHREQLRVVADCIVEDGGDASDFPGFVNGRGQGATLDGDPARLRGLPAVGRNVSGRIPGTDPLRALLAKEARCERRNGS